MSDDVPEPQFRKAASATKYYGETWERRCLSCGGRGNYTDVVGGRLGSVIQFCQPCLGVGWVPCDPPTASGQDAT